MRFVDIRVRPAGGWSRFDERVRGSESVSRGPINQLSRLRDDSVVMLFELSGDPDQARELLDEYFEVISYEVSVTGTTTSVYAHLDPQDHVRSLIEIPEAYSVVIDTPMEFIADGYLRVTVVGDQTDIQQLTDDIPDDAEFSIGRTGTYHPGTERLFGSLTDRQQEVLLTALEEGYYEQPRKATMTDLGEEMGLTSSTVAEHLRKVEKRVLTGVTPS